MFEYPKTDMVEVANKTELLMAEHKIDASNVCIDGVGIGAGVIDILNRKNHRIIDFIGGATVDMPKHVTIFKFKNKRACLGRAEVFV